MATTTITITSATQPTYGGHFNYDGVVYSREELNAANPTVSFDGSTAIRRAFAFFDLSTDPTSGGTITKVELLATVSSVSGTHAVNVLGCDVINAMSFPNPPTGWDDENTYNNAPNANPHASGQTYSAGAIAQDLGAQGITDVNATIAAHNWFGSFILLSDEGTAGSVVFDAATGFGLRITYTPIATGGPPPFVDPYGMGAVSPYQNEDE